jgi:hypothetical protein
MTPLTRLISWLVLSRAACYWNDWPAPTPD